MSEEVTTTTEEVAETSAQTEQTTQADAVETQTQAPDWKANLSPEQQEYVTNKGFTGPEAVLDSYINLEKLRGVPQDRLLKLPEGEDKESWNEIYNRLGRPESADGYGFNAGEEDADKFLKETFHELGLTKAQAETLMERYSTFEQGKSQEMQANYEKQVEAQDLELKKEWGAAYHSNIAKAQAAAKEFGIEGEVIDAIEKAVGYDGVMKLMYTIGSKLGEDSYINGDGTTSSGAMTPQQARVKIDNLMKDSEFVNKYISGDYNARKEMERLHEYLEVKTP